MTGLYFVVFSWSLPSDHFRAPHIRYVTSSCHPGSYPGDLLLLGAPNLSGQRGGAERLLRAQGAPDRVARLSCRRHLSEGAAEQRDSYEVTEPRGLSFRRNLSG